MKGGMQERRLKEEKRKERKTFKLKFFIVSMPSLILSILILCPGVWVSLHYH